MVKITKVGAEPSLKLSCPNDCGPLKYGRSIDIIRKCTHCKKCKGIMLSKNEIEEWENNKIPVNNKMKKNKLLAFLDTGTDGALDCPQCSRKMKEIDLEYKKSRTMSRLEDGAKNPKKIAGEIAIDWIPVIGALFQFTRFIGEVGGDLTKGKLEKSVTIDGCASCFIFWFDRGEIVQIMGNDVTTKSEVDKKY